MFSDKVVNFKDFSRPNKGIMYLSRTLTEFKDFSRQQLKLKTFSRSSEPCNYIVIVVCSNFPTKHLAPVVQKLGSPIHWINHYPVDKY